MRLNLADLNEATRQLMLEELGKDRASGKIYRSKRAALGTDSDYFQAQRSAFESGNPDLLVEALAAPGFFLSHQSDGKQINGREAASVLGDGQFIVYHARAMCRRAIAEGREIEIYRAEDTRIHRRESDEVVGSRPDPTGLLNELRENSDQPWKLSTVGKPNSGLAVRLT